MYYDNSCCLRFTWKYPYFGSELIDYVSKTKDKFENNINQTKSTLKDLEERNPRSSQISDLREFLAENEKEYEACKVFMLECIRDRNRVFDLALGDVVYFGIIE